MMKKALNFIEKRLAAYMLVFIAVFAVALIVYKADWLMGDNYLFIKTTAQCRPAPFFNPVNIGSSRFFPLAGLDFNILLLLPGGMGCSAMAHYIYVAVSFLAMYAFFLLSLRKILLPKTKYAMSFILLAGLLLAVNKSAFMTFLNVNYAERMIALLFALFIFCIAKSGMAENRDIAFGRWHILAIICAALSTYMKETVFAFYFAFSAVSLLFFHKKMNVPQKKLHLILLANGILFIILYLCFGFNYRGSYSYSPEYTMGFFGILKSIFLNIKVLFAIFLAAGIRFFLVFLKKSSPQPVFDPLLIASSVYICEYAVLGFNDYYYYFPAIASGMVPLFYFLADFADKAARMDKNAFLSNVFLLAVAALAALPVIELPKAMLLAKITVSGRMDTMPCLRNIAQHYLDGGNIYWHQPVQNDRRMPELTALYLNYILGGKKQAAISLVPYVPDAMQDNDVFIYSASDGKDNYAIDDSVIRQLEKQNFKFSRRIADYFVFYKNAAMENT